MSSTYPGTLDNFATNKEDDTDSKTGADQGISSTVGDHATHHNNLADAINKIEAELGTDPSGTYSTVKDRFLGDTSWQQITITPAQGSFSPSTLDYRKDGMGFVHLKGETRTVTTTGTGTSTIGTFPAGYRPGVTIRTIYARAGATADFFTIDSSGNLALGTNVTTNQAI